MTKRDKDKLDRLLIRLTAEFSEKRRQSTTVWRGEARAIVSAIRTIAADEKRNERTGARVAKIAAKVLAVKTKTPAKDLGILAHDGSGIVIRWSDIRALAAAKQRAGR